MMHFHFSDVISDVQVVVSGRTNGTIFCLLQIVGNFVWDRF